MFVFVKLIKENFIYLKISLHPKIKLIQLYFISYNILLLIIFDYFLFDTSAANPFFQIEPL